MKISSTNSEIVLDFDSQSPHVSAHRLRVLATALSGVDGVSAVRLTWFGAPQIVAAYSSERNPTELLRQAAAALRKPHFDPASVSAQPLSPNPAVTIRFSGVSLLEHGIEQAAPSPVTWSGRLKQFLYGGLSCGTFVMSWVGLLVPGIPTVPFVILTVYFAERASPTLSRAILNSPVLGPMLRDWHEHRAIRRTARWQALTFTGALILITLVLAPPSVGLYLSVGIVASLSVYLLLSIPEMEDDPQTSGAPHDHPATLPWRFAGA